MAESFSVTEAWRRLAEANVRYYTGYARITREYFDEVVATLRGPATSGGSVPLGAQPAAAASQPATPPRPVAMALDGALGETVTGAFVVENALNRHVRAAIVASEDGGSTSRLRFDPEVVDLGPGEHVLVRAIATIDEAIEPGTQRRAEVTVPGLPGTRINVLIRRSAD